MGDAGPTGATGATGPAPEGTGLVEVNDGVVSVAPLDLNVRSWIGLPSAENLATAMGGYITGYAGPASLLVFDTGPVLSLPVISDAIRITAGTQHSTARIRFPYAPSGVQIGAVGASGLDIDWISKGGGIFGGSNALRIGNTTEGGTRSSAPYTNVVGANLYLHFEGGGGIYAGVVPVLAYTPSDQLNSFALPLSGYGTGGVQLNYATATITRNDPSDYTALPNEYQAPILIVNGNPTADFAIILPVPPTSGAAASHVVHNTTAFNLTIKKLGGVGTVIAPNTARTVFWSTGTTDYFATS